MPTENYRPYVSFPESARAEVQQFLDEIGGVAWGPFLRWAALAVIRHPELRRDAAEQLRTPKQSYD